MAGGRGVIQEYFKSSLIWAGELFNSQIEVQQDLILPFPGLRGGLINPNGKHLQ